VRAHLKLSSELMTRSCPACGCRCDGMMLRESLGIPSIPPDETLETTICVNSWGL